MVRSTAGSWFWLVLLLATATATAPAIANAARPQFAWQESHARVLPTGDLEWTPRPFVFKAGTSVRYIDYQNGDDDRDGATKETAWKHHPWDTQAAGRAKAAGGEAHTYVFKRGVVYRGALRPQAAKGTAQDPVQLTSDPAWGEGEAMIYGSAVVSGWKKGAGANEKIPEADKVYVAEVSFLPRTLWAVSGDGTISRLKLARTPNWTEPDPNDVMSQWPAWQNPEWWKGEGHTLQAGGRKLHAGIDKKGLTGTREDYVGATVWSEWGIVMGSPYPARVEAFDAAQKAVAFRGPWTWERSEKIIAGNRYYLEDKPQFLDEAGEFWVEKIGDTKARIYLRLPGDADPSSVTVEAGRYENILDAGQLEHVHVSGLTFRFTNVHWQYNAPSWSHPDLKAAVIRLTGSGDGIVIRNCTFEHVNMATRLLVGSTSDRIGSVSITDNIIRHTDHGAVQVAARFDTATPGTYGRLGHVDLLRNHLHHIGWRIISGEHGHAVNITFPESSHLAGNFLHRIAGWGLSVTGGKPSGAHRGPTAVEIPFNRHLIHHNRVEDALLKSNDWGAIETWQGGPFYIFNNVVFNPVAFKHWTFKPGDPTNIGSFGHAYYLDGSFKNYVFNNIGAGRNNELGTKGVNSTAVQNIFSFENTFFHNTFHKFAAMTRQQAPAAGRFRYLGNVMEDISGILFRHADPKEGQRDPNAAHYTQGGQFAYNTLAYANNVIHDLRGTFGVFEETGFTYADDASMKDSLRQLNAQAADIGVVAGRSSLRDPAGRDFRPADGAASAGRGVKVYVPWALHGVVGEWNFVRNNADPAEMIDEHWYMTPMYGKREDYKQMPRYPLTLVNGDANSHVPGVLEDWAEATAVRLNGKDQHLVLEHARLVLDSAPVDRKTTEFAFGTVEHPTRLMPGRPLDVVVRLADASPAQQVDLHVHWLKRDGWGGFNTLGGQGEPVEGEPGAFRFRPVVQAKNKLTAYQFVVFLSPDGEFNNKTADAKISVPPATLADSLDTQQLRTVNIDTGPFLIEAMLQTTDGDGLIVGKSAGKAGYVFDLTGGRPRLRLLDEKGATYTATARAAINDGAWHHVIIEVDRNAGARLYVDGREVELAAEGRMPGGSLANAADFYVGGGPDVEHLEMTLDTLRIARGTLADAKTTIEELYAWQFEGPHHRDFAGNDRRNGTNAAGALVK
ncbi:MAG: LamG domain-containing protein [Phycisphaerae bacterium]